MEAKEGKSNGGVPLILIANGGGGNRREVMEEMDFFTSHKKLILPEMEILEKEL